MQELKGGMERQKRQEETQLREPSFKLYKYLPYTFHFEVFLLGDAVFGQKNMNNLCAQSCIKKLFLVSKNLTCLHRALTSNTFDTSGMD